MVNKLYRISFIMYLLLHIPSSWAENVSGHYRTLDIKVELTKQTKNFQVKNLFPLHFPLNLPGRPMIKGFKGQFSTITQARFDPKTGKENTSSETLFSIGYSQRSCPKYGEEVDGYPEFGRKYRSVGLMSDIVKQTQGNKEQISKVDFMNAYSNPIQIDSGGCVILMFDGTDFADKPYTMKADLKMYYTFAPISIGLGGEFIISSDNQKTSTLNAYVVIPVTNNPHPRGIVFHPGNLYSVNGNISTSAAGINVKGNWFVRYITAVYKKNRCQTVFKNHLPYKFFWNDKTGTSKLPNPSSVFREGVIIIADYTVQGKDRESVMIPVHGNQNLPIHVEEGDCVVQVGMPYGDSTTASGNHMNMETQVNVQYIPD